MYYQNKDCIMANPCIPQPTPEYLQLLVGSVLRWNKRKEENQNRLYKKVLKHELIEKAVRMWYILSQVEEDLGNGERDLTLDEWIHILYRPKIDSYPYLQIQEVKVNEIIIKLREQSKLKNSRSLQSKKNDNSQEPIFVKADGYESKMPRKGEGRISSAKIPELLFFDNVDREKKWAEWKKAFLEYQKPYRRDYVEEINESELDKIEPFYVVKKTIKNTLKSLVELDSLIFYTGEKYSYSKEKELPITLVAFENKTINSLPALDLGEFESYFKSFGNPIEAIQRFYIREDYKEFDTIARVKVNVIRNTLKNIWEVNITVPIELDYHISSEELYKAIVYPLAIYYNQRAFYLCAYGGDKEGNKFDWHNYRVDRIQSIRKLDWNNRIPKAINDYLQKASEDSRKRDMTLDEYLISEKVEYPLQVAYGFDFYLESTETILRFNQDFHNRYIKNTFRHVTFKRILTEEQLEESIYKHPNLRSSMQKYPDDAYYKMEYRINDNTVIMRLRAWGQNVEVISPPELRNRMREDTQKTWDLYS